MLFDEEKAQANEIFKTIVREARQFPGEHKLCRGTINMSTAVLADVIEQVNMTNMSARKSSNSTLEVFW